MKRFFTSFLLALGLIGSSVFAGPARADHYTNFDAAVYIPVSVVQRLANPATLRDQWNRIRRQVKVDKVYIEVQRNRVLARGEVLDRVKQFFLNQGVRVAGGMALSDGGNGQFRSFCYTDPSDRAFIKRAVELAARHFNEIIQDDFFFDTTKYPSDIAAKGTNSWTQFRLKLMDDAAEHLLLQPARAINPKVRMIIKFPNWYEHFQGLGYDLDKEPKLFDGIYTGTETRDPDITDQNLQPYESYQIFRYFENIAPGRNGGGWVDTFSIRYVDRYAEQLWDTLFAKAPQIMLFEWSGLLRPIHPGNRAAWRNLPTSFNYQRMVQTYHDSAPFNSHTPTMASVAGYSLRQVDSFLGKLGQPIGIACYKPYQSTGEDFLHNYFGMIGIPIDLHPAFPTNANLVLLTESAKFDPNIVAKIKGQLMAGKSVVITSGLLRALQGKGIDDIVELRATDRKVLSHQYVSAFGAGNGTVIGKDNHGDVLFPVIDFLTNDAWALVRAMAHGRGFPLLLMDRYGKGVLYVWTMPDNLNDLYRLPPAVLSAFKHYLLRGFPIQLDGPARVALFAYDNHTFIVESYLDTPSDVEVSVTGGFTRLRNLVSGEVITSHSALGAFDPPARVGKKHRVSFKLHLPPHSYRVLAEEK